MDSPLEILAADLRDEKDRTREEFTEIFARALRVLDIDDVTAARALCLSRPTVVRWTRGESAPHPLGRGAALQWLSDEADRRLNAGSGN